MTALDPVDSEELRLLLGEVDRLQAENDALTAGLVQDPISKAIIGQASREIDERQARIDDALALCDEADLDIDGRSYVSRREVRAALEGTSG